MALQQLKNLVKVLESYRGHDGFIRLVNYVAMFMGGEGNTRGEMKWRTVAKEMSACRVILRLFDDLPMFLYNLSTAYGLKGSNNIVKVLDLLIGLLYQGFYPTEHIAWLKQKKILNGMALPYIALGIAIWAVALILDLIKAVIKLRLIAVQSKKLVKQQQLDTDGHNQSFQNQEIKENLKKLSAEKKDEILSIFQNGLDLINAISWSPPGFLWGQSLPTSANGFLGTIASVIILYRKWPSVPVKDKKN